MYDHMCVCRSNDKERKTEKEQSKTTGVIPADNFKFRKRCGRSLLSVFLPLALPQLVRSYV